MGVYLPGENWGATQGPSPDGFHVPSVTEWQGLKTIMDGLSLTTGGNWRISLHMPFAGYRNYSNASLYYQGSYGYYWSSSPYGSDYPVRARSLYLSSSYVGANYSNSRAHGYSVRCFKDSYEAPDSSWTIVQGSLGSAGIFWNQSEGLISITDGSTRYTMMDKNLGATTVYNDGDTLTQANMGNMYQWGNNYGFPSTGTITNTSSTQVDASGYGPGNCYSSSTFITGSDDRSSVHNDNLRGGEDGNIPIMSELKNAYIGEYAEPTAILDADFTTLSSLDGFTVSSNGGTQLNSNGLSRQTSSSDRILDIYHDLPGSRTGAKKVTMTMELYGNYRSWGLVQWFELQNTDGNKGIAGGMSFNNNGSSYQGNDIYMLSGTTLASRTQANGTGTYTYTIEVDLITGEWSGGYTGPNTFSGSGTLTSAQIDEIMQTTRVHVNIRGQYTDYNRLRKLNVTIEY